MEGCFHDDHDRKVNGSTPNLVSLLRPWISDVQESEPESSKFFRSRIRLGVKFNVKTGVGAGATISLSYYCNVN